MTNVAFVQPLRSISSHAIERYQDRVEDVPRPAARIGVFRLYNAGQDATEYQAKRILGKDFDGETVPRICTTCYGTFVLLVKRGIVVTLWRVS